MIVFFIRSYTSDYGSQNGGEHPRAFHSGRGGGGPGKAPPGWREAHNNRGRKAPYPDRPRSVPWQQKSPQARDHGPPSPWQSKSQENYLGYASSSQPSDAHRRYGDPAPPRPGLAQCRPSPHDPSLAQRRPSPHDPSLAQRRPSPHDPSLARSHHSRQYDGGPRGFQSRPQNPDHRSHNKQVYPQPPPHHRSPFRTPRQEEQRPWGSRSQSPSCPSRRPLPKHQHIMTQAGDRGRGRGGRGRGGGGGVSGNGCGRQAFWGGDRGPADRGNPPYPSPRGQHHHPQPRNGEGRCPPSNSPLRKEREFHSRERYQESPQVVLQAG